MALAALAATCAPASPPLLAYDAAAHAEDVEAWRQWRHAELTKPDGWLSLSGLYWLPPGTYRFGSDQESDLVYTRDGVPAHLGTFEVTTERVTFEPDESLEIMVGDAPLAETLIFDSAWRDQEGVSVPELVLEELRWYVIVREDHLALRVKDAISPRVVDFAGMPNFELAADWRFDATFEAYDPPRIIKVPNVFGTLGDEESPGAVVFEHDGTEYRIDMWKDSGDPDNFFTAFGDASNGFSSYGAGRFVWVDAPDEFGRTVVDFNRAYNPPCALSPFATCPLPPMQNRLPIAIEAGEMAPEAPVELPAPPPAEG